MRRRSRLRGGTEGSALLEFAITLPLLVVFIVGIYDFSGAYNQRQKIEHAAQVGAIVAGGQPTADMDSASANPDSLQAPVVVIFNALASDSVLPLANQGSCKPPVVPAHTTGLIWTYSITNCPDTLTITIDRGVVDGGTPAIVGTAVTVTYPYHWRFNSAIQLLFPAATYAATTNLSETASVHNQM